MVGIRAEALTWWRSLPQETKENLVKEHFPNIAFQGNILSETATFTMIDKSSSRIEGLYLKIKSIKN